MSQNRNFQKLGKYVLLELIASGGMAEVFLSVGSGAEGVHKFFAIKKILAAYSENNDFIKMFKDEAKLASQLNHSNIINIFDFGVDRISQFYIVMEFVHGKNLKQIIQALGNENRKLPIEFIAFIGKEVASALDYAHQSKDITSGQPLNIIHRDISPQNIMISFNAEVKIIDFGIAKTNSVAENTNAGTLKGKFGYMSPEQVKAEPVDYRTDLFSLGVVLWELIANRRLFASETELETINKIKSGIIPDLKQFNESIPDDLSSIIFKCLQTDPNDRYVSGQELYNSLNVFLNKHYPEFNKHTFSEYLKTTFVHSFEKTNERILSYSRMKVSTDDFSELDYSTPMEGSYRQTELTKGSKSVTRNSSSLKNIEFKTQDLSAYKELEEKKDLKWIYSLMGIVAVFFLFFIYNQNQKTGTKTQIIQNAKIEKKKIDQIKNSILNFPNILTAKGIGNQACLQNANKQFFCWGDNRFHQLGISTSQDYASSVEITDHPVWDFYSLGYFHSCGITQIIKNTIPEKVLKCWGDNSYGQVGDPTQSNIQFPTTIDPKYQYKDISLGMYHSCGLTTEGYIRCWGRGDFAQLGIFQVKSSKVPLPTDMKYKFIKISSGSYHTCAIHESGALRCWGRSDYGQLGYGQINFQGSIQNVDVKTKYIDISLGDYHSCGITKENKIKCWGKNDFGQLGLGHQEPTLEPNFILSNLDFKKIKSGKTHTCARTMNDELWCWGRNNYFQISDKEKSFFSHPEKVTQLEPQSDFFLGESSTCYSAINELHCKGYHWGQNTRSPAESE